jgi:hypothetical protein
MFRAITITEDDESTWIHLPNADLGSFLNRHLEGIHRMSVLAAQTDETPEILLADVGNGRGNTHPANLFATSVAEAYGHSWSIYGPAIILAVQDGNFVNLTDEIWSWIINVHSGRVAAPVKPIESTPIVSFRELLAANPDTVTDDTEVIITAGELRERLDELGRLRAQAEEDAALVGWYLHFDETPYESRLAVLCNHFGPRAKAALEARAAAILTNANTPT